MERNTRGSDDRQNPSQLNTTEVEHADYPRDSKGMESGRFNRLKRFDRSKHAKFTKQRKPWFLQRILNEWFNRLLGAASDRSFSSQEEMYAADRTSRDYIWNTVGVATWGMMFPLLTMVVTQLVGVEQAGMFSMAFVVGLLLMIVANYGVRTFQISDVEETHSFADYQINRIITCAIMVVVGLIYCAIRGYSEEMFTLSMGVYLYKMIDGLADVYEGRLQQVGKLYLAGISQSVRSVLVLVIFSLCLLITRSLEISCIAMAVTAIISFIVLTLPLAFLESPKSRRFNTTAIQDLFKQCFPLFIAIFMFNLIDSMPKFVMEGMLTYDNQLYFNALYFPAQAILLGMQLVYKPQILRMARLWSDAEKHKKFDLMMVVVIVGTIVLTAVGMLLMGTIGIPIMSFLYGINFEEFRELCFVMMVAGGVTAGIDFLYQAITIMRKQQAVTKLYLLTFGFSLFIPTLLIGFTGLPGAILSYLIIMSILFILLVTEYISIRWNSRREMTARVADSIERKRPSEMRAERERLGQHRGGGMSKGDK